ncbi:cytochrome P450 [Variovorax terrae]|uniref:Cytochrome P450 n=1 Tax=Variovorax terrae TaxID=2923278 RepID=A0A9X2AM51_9BURK|nr:cytochrome P450 [Variovorax terrae]MCJ0762919.1 cytochrome P450 [Variovorax terrae]
MPAPLHALDAVTHPDPYPFYQQLRRQPPLHFDTHNRLWIASRAEVVAEAFAHPALRVRPPQEPVPRALAGTAAREVFALLVRMNDGAFHAQHRPAVAAAAARWSLPQVHEASRAAVPALREALDVNDFLTALPVAVMARLLGVPTAQQGLTVQWVHDFTRGIAPGASAEAVAQGVAAAQHLMAQGQALGLDRVQAANRVALMQQSLDATAGLLGNTACLLRQQPGLGETLAASMDQARLLVAEVARWDAPVQNTRRYAAQDTVLAGQPLRQGEGVLLVVASANRDEALNPQPERFEAQRAHRRSFTFGAAAHACPGEAIAIEIVASCVQLDWTSGGFDSFFGRCTGYRPLSNVRIPVFSVD